MSTQPNCGHPPAMYDMWLIARGVMYTDGHYVTTWAQPQTAAPSEPAAPADARDALLTRLNTLDFALAECDAALARQAAALAEGVK